MNSDVTLKHEQKCFTQNYDAVIDDLRKRLQADPNTVKIPVILSVQADDFSVTHAPAKAAFLEDGPIYEVTIFPKESCSCPVPSTCCHVIAAKRSIGLECEPRRKLNLSELLKRKR